MKIPRFNQEKYTIFFARKKYKNILYKIQKSKLVYVSLEQVIFKLRKGGGDDFLLEKIWRKIKNKLNCTFTPRIWIQTNYVIRD